ncbi:MAG: PEP-CTERM sorting domain-containing protein, partial [Gemmataceae bacterium]
YATRAAFDAANPGTALETFESAAATGVLISGPQDRAADNRAFRPGAITPGLRLTPVGLVGRFYVSAGDYGPTTTLTTDEAAGYARLDFFRGDVTAFGLDLGAASSGGRYEARVFGRSGLLDTQIRSAASGPVFFGFRSDVPVVRVELQAPGYETIDNVAFGAAGVFAPPPPPPPEVAAVPEPSSFALLGTAGFAAAGYLGWRRRRAA